MPRFNSTPPNGDSRKALQERAREASRPATPQDKGRWPFPVAGADADDERKGSHPSADQGIFPPRLS